tara:strand:+ start:1295 stop:1615 length:321 start_codon:yes stop_codon:yes gene_type:complete
MDTKNLENQIEKLTTALVELHEFLKGEDLKNEVVEAVNPAFDTVDDFIQNSFTETEVKNTCMRIARGIPDGRNKVKAVLAKYGAVKAADLKEEHRKEFINTIKGLK